MSTSPLPVGTIVRLVRSTPYPVDVNTLWTITEDLGCDLIGSLDDAMAPRYVLTSVRRYYVARLDVSNLPSEWPITSITVYEDEIDPVN
jgi:hypothetical protein